MYYSGNAVLFPNAPTIHAVFNETEGLRRYAPLQQDIRNWANTRKNLYITAALDCCREVQRHDIVNVGSNLNDIPEVDYSTRHGELLILFACTAGGILKADSKFADAILRVGYMHV